MCNSHHICPFKYDFLFDQYLHKFDYITVYLHTVYGYEKIFYCLWVKYEVWKKFLRIPPPSKMRKFFEGEVFLVIRDDRWTSKPSTEKSRCRIEIPWVVWAPCLSRSISWKQHWIHISHQFCAPDPNLILQETLNLGCRAKISNTLWNAFKCWNAIKEKLH